MTMLYFLSSLIFGWDVDRLGDSRFEVRHAAHQRLSAVGWFAYPALLVGRQSRSAECVSRSDDLAEWLERPLAMFVQVEGMARGVDPIPDATPTPVLKAVCRRINQLGGWIGSSDCWWWVSIGKHHRETVAGDCEFVAKIAAAHRTMQHVFPPLVPVQPTK